jgi:hypothetical protein
MPGEKEALEAVILASKRDSKLRLQETIALGLLVAKKWDRALSEVPKSGKVTPEELKKGDNFTEDDMQGFRATAQSILHDYTITLPRQIEKPRRSWAESGWGVAEGFAAAILYSFFLAIIFLILKLVDADFITVLRRLIGPEKG